MTSRQQTNGEGQGRQGPGQHAGMCGAVSAEARPLLMIHCELLGFGIDYTGPWLAMVLYNHHAAVCETAVLTCQQTMVVVPMLCRCMASGLSQPTLGCHLQCYVAAKVHSDQAAYSSAMSAILTGLEQHKQVQPEIAVFCRVSTSVAYTASGSWVTTWLLC
jgi:hypothetical protein